MPFGAAPATNGEGRRCRVAAARARWTGPRAPRGVFWRSARLARRAWPPSPPPPRAPCCQQVAGWPGGGAGGEHVVHQHHPPVSAPPARAAKARPRWSLPLPLVEAHTCRGVATRAPATSPAPGPVGDAPQQGPLIVGVALPGSARVSGTGTRARPGATWPAPGRLRQGPGQVAAVLVLEVVDGPRHRGPCAESRPGREGRRPRGTGVPEGPRLPRSALCPPTPQTREPAVGQKPPRLAQHPVAGRAGLRSHALHSPSTRSRQSMAQPGAGAPAAARAPAPASPVATAPSAPKVPLQRHGGGRPAGRPPPSAASPASAGAAARPGGPRSSARWPRWFPQPTTTSGPQGDAHHRQGWPGSRATARPAKVAKSASTARAGAQRELVRRREEAQGQPGQPAVQEGHRLPPRPAPAAPGGVRSAQAEGRALRAAENTTHQWADTSPSTAELAPCRKPAPSRPPG